MGVSGGLGGAGTGFPPPNQEGVFPTLGGGEPLSSSRCVALEAEFGVRKSAGLEGLERVRGGSGPSQAPVRRTPGGSRAPRSAPRGRGDVAFGPSLPPVKMQRQGFRCLLREGGELEAPARPRGAFLAPPSPRIFMGWQKWLLLPPRRPHPPLPPLRTLLGRGLLLAGFVGNWPEAGQR